MKKLIVSVLALVLTFGAVVAQGVGETAPRDGNRTTALLLMDPATGRTDRWESDGLGAAKIVFGASSVLVVNQGISGVSDADPWNFMLRNAAGVEQGLAASPFGVRLFDGAAAAFGTGANPIRIDPTGTTPQPVSQGAAAALSGRWPVELTDGTNGADVSPAGELEVSGDGGVDLAIAANQITANASLVDIELNTDTGQTASEPVVVSVGTTATLILAADANRRTATIQNAGTSPVFLGKSGVTTSAGIIIAGSSVANDGKGTVAEASHGDAIFGIVTSGTVNVRVQTESD